MKFYKTLSTIKFLKKSYAMKFLFIAFLGIHIPLIGIVLYVGLWAPDNISPLTLVLLTLVFTLAATAATLIILNKLLMPVKLAEQSLLDYIKNQKMPNLPTHFKDEVGILLQSIQHTIESLDEVNKTKSELMYTITHDLRNPLAQIITLTDLVKPDNEESDKWLGMIKASAIQELSFIDNYITILETHEYRVEENRSSEVSFVSLIDMVLQTLDGQIKNKELQVQLNLAAQAVVTTTKDLLFKHVILNLVGNAIKFSYPKSKIIIETKVTTDKTIFSVTDEGVGFEQSTAIHLFEKFTHLKREGTSGEPTNGIGLYLTKEIVKKHNGTIWTTSSGADKGATFTVEILNG
jgi:signal transduction histidine kinase